MDPRYKIQFVDWGYKKLYKPNSRQFQEVRGSLFALFQEYASRAPSNSICNGSTSQPIDDSRDVFKVRS